MTTDLLIPALALALIGWLVPRLLSLVFPEGVRPLMLLTFTAAVIMFCIGSGFFVVLYLWQGAPFDALMELGLGPAAAHFGRLGMISSLFWAPILVLSVAGLPKTWVKETW